MRLPYSLRFRLMIFYLLIFFALAVIMVTAMPFYYQNSISQERQVLTEGTLTSIARNIETYLDDLNRLTITPYLNDEIMRALKLKASENYYSTDPYTRLVADRALRTTLPLFLQNSRRDIIATVLVAPDGSAFIASTGGAISEPEASYPYTQQSWYQKAITANGDVVFISAHAQDYLGETPARRVFSVARLIKDPDTRRPLGVIMADADTVVLARIVNDIYFSVSSIVCIFDNENKLLYSSRPISADLQRRALGQISPIKSDGDSYVAVSKETSQSQWKVVVLLSNAEIAEKTGWLYVSGALFALGGLLVTFALFFALSRWIALPFQEMIAVMKQVQTGNLQARLAAVGDDEIGELGRALNHMIDRLNQLIDSEYKAVIGQRNAEYRALQSQLHPHFLYNTLNGFVGLNRLKDSAGLENAILALSEMLHYILEGDEWVRLDDEIKFVQKYCDLQRLRFRDRLMVDIQWEEAVADMRVPRLLLQPLVENAVIHGIEPAVHPCTLIVTAALKPGDDPPLAQITVRDDGCGFDPRSLNEHAGLGLANVRERLRLAFREAILAISSQVDSGTHVTIEIPVQPIARMGTAEASRAE